MQSMLLVFTSLVASALAWAPPTHPAPGQLPKALEFAEKAWKFPKPSEIHPDAVVALQTVEHLERRFPWSPVGAQDQSLYSMEGEEEEDCEHHFFDRIGGDVLCWTEYMGLAETLKHAKKVTDQLSTTHSGHEVFNEEECDEPFYDETGDVHAGLSS